MAKRDFMSELAEEAKASKKGTGTIRTVDDFHSKHHEDVKAEEFVTREEPEPVSSSTKEEEVIEPETEGEIPLFVNRESEPDGEEEEEPTAFDEEERVRIDKPKRKLNKGVLIGLIVAAVAIVALIVYIVFVPKISMPNFVGQTKTDVSNWAKQNKIETSSIALKEEYSLEYDADYIIDQSVAEGKKIKTSTPITLTVSKGADPDELIEVPDIMNSTMDELKEWADTNKLTKTKITSEYNTTVPEGEVISYDMKNVSESEFTRGSTLTIKCSKGSAPAGKVTVENYVGKTYTEAQVWATNKKLVVAKEEVNSSTVDSGKVISQVPESGSALSEGDTITFVVSKGKGVNIPNLVGYTKEQLAAWQANADNKVTVVTKSVWDESAAGSVIAQSIAAGTTVDENSVLELTISLYLPILETDSNEWIGKNYLALKAWCDDVNSKGADIQAGEWGEYATREYSSTIPEGGIIEYACEFGTSSQGNGCERPLNTNARIKYKVSLGPAPTTTTVSDIVLTTSALADLSSIKSFCDSNGLACTYTPDTTGTVANISATIGGTTYVTGQSVQVIIKSTDSVTVVYNSGATATATPTATPTPTSTPEIK